ncbi:Crp/Fnr family transcriptional regulator [Pedobacter caeni]|uniref:cAMP-binding domain of CRP or a regulatory subunit of cAMP-dependent protein kinases n=1 Tax=Pedobacter caeni TaxID=288992 RepID=A0A1M5H4V6_9SPHI|nr:Crp/Fnr family transcriptional regulator [Pedobacter caeni]SHG10938.1 cAMP-binding domain of CRP or a regulatory subunit of cAMP-dependent protein kinases [Pedobacter caeni]
MENERFFNSLAGTNKPSNELKTQFCKMVEKEIRPKNHTILKAGQICDNIWFLAQGFAMAYIEKEDRKIPYCFWNENEVMVPVNSFFKQVPADGFIEIMEKSTLMAISYRNMKQLSANFPEFNLLMCHLVEDMQYASEKRIFNLTSISAEERYALLLKEAPFIVRKTSVELIATYLGVSRKTLNRIRAKK